MKVLAHIVTVLVLLAMLLGVPMALGKVSLSALFTPQDAGLVSTATTIQEAPPGHYTVLINTQKHQDAEVLGYWVDFFEGKDVPLIMEDVSCATSSLDANGIEMACSYSSRLPANQMKVHVDDTILLLSKVDAGRFDIVVMSDEIAERFDALGGLDDATVKVVHR